jgi:hypothetical protein
MLFLAGCPYSVSVPGDKLAPTESDVSELGPGSLPVEVTSYAWEVWSGSHIRVYGEVVNNGPRPLQGVTLTGVLHDQSGAPVSFGECYVAPSYLPVGGTGKFEFVGLAKRVSGIGATRLVTTSKTLSAF